MKNILSAILLVSMFFSATLIFAVSDTELKGVAERVANGTASGTDKAVAFKHNKEINNLAMNGQLSGDPKTNNEIYQKNQKTFDQTNNELAANAAKKNGLNTSGKPRDTFKAGTDTDIQMNTPGDKKLTANDVAKTRKDYNTEVDNYLKKNGVETSGNENWAKKTETDIMPNPNQMADGEFKKSAELINKDGGNMYKNKSAADTQLRIDSKKGVCIDESPAYTKELQEKVKHMKEEKAELQKELKTTNDPDRKAHLETEMKKCESHEAKYIDRINKLNTAAREANGLAPADNKTPSAGDKALTDAQTRDFTKGPDGKMSKSEKAAHTVDALDKHLTNKALENYNDTVAEIGKNPQHAKQSQQIIAENIKNLPPAQQGETISRLENKYGKDFAKGVAESVRTSRASSSTTTAPVDVADPGFGKKIPKGASVAIGLGLITAGLNSYNEEMEAARAEKRDPSYGKMAANTVYAATVGGYVGAAKSAFKAVTTDTAEYRKQLEDEYKKSGADVNSSATQLKIWAQATAYGSGLGAWHGAHVIPVIGDVLGAGETVINVSADALNTLNELEIQEANIKVQGENEHLIALQAVRKAGTMVSSMESIDAQVKLLKAELNKTCGWASDTSEKYNTWKTDIDNKLKEYQKVLAAIAEMKNNNQKSGFFTNDYAGQAAKDLASIKNTAINHSKAADELMKKYQGQIQTLKPEDRQLIQNIIAEFNQNNERFQNRLGELTYLSEISQNGDMSKYVQALGNNIKDELKSAHSVSLNSGIALKNMESLIKQIGDASNNMVKLKAGFKRGEAYFGKRDETTKDQWAQLSARVALIKNIEFNPGDYKRDQNSLNKLADNVNNYLKSTKVADAGDLTWLDAAAKTAKNTLAVLQTPMNEAAVELDKASGKIAFLAGLLNLGGATLKVAVKDAASGTALNGATVTLKVGTDSKSVSVSADANGLALFIDVPNGDIDIYASAAEHADGALKVKVDIAKKMEYMETIALKKSERPLEPPKNIISGAPEANLSWSSMMSAIVPFARNNTDFSAPPPKVNEIYGFKKVSANEGWKKMIEEGMCEIMKRNGATQARYYYILSINGDVSFLRPQYMKQKEEEFFKNQQPNNPKYVKLGSNDVMVANNSQNGWVDCIGVVPPFQMHVVFYPEGEYHEKSMEARVPQLHAKAMKVAMDTMQQICDKLRAWTLMRVGSGNGIKGWYYPFDFVACDMKESDLQPDLKFDSPPADPAKITTYQVYNIQDKNFKGRAEYLIRIEPVLPETNDKTADECIKKTLQKLQKEQGNVIDYYKSLNLKNEHFKIQEPGEMKIKGADYACFSNAVSDYRGGELIVICKSNLYIYVKCTWDSRQSTKNVVYKCKTKELADKVMEKILKLPNYCP